MFEVEEKKLIYIEKPKKYKVIMHNDNKTAFEFVIEVLQTVFKKDGMEAWKLALTIHVSDKAVVGVYVKDIAETKVKKTMSMASESGFSSFKVTIEEE